MNHVLKYDKESQASVLLKGLGHEMTIFWKDYKLSQHFLDMRKCCINVQTALLKDEVLTLQYLNFLHQKTTKNCENRQRSYKK